MARSKRGWSTEMGQVCLWAGAITVLSGTGILMIAMYMGSRGYWHWLPAPTCVVIICGLGLIIAGLAIRA